jgi:hypothetical protein
MKTLTRFALAMAAAAALFGTAALAQQSPALKVGENDIGGTVTGPHGPEAGVWVIAETTELPTRFARIVVTDDKGRYLVPDLPKADYSVWVRGYGLVDSPKVHGVPGKMLNLAAVPAPTAADAASYYPAIYWYSMLKIPGLDQFGGKSAIPANVTQQEYITHLKNRDCVGCHQLGQLATRTIPAAFSGMSSEEAWMRRVQSGQAAPFMVNPLAGQLGGVPFHYFADWTDRIAKGALPHAKPPRPSGIERDVVITEWDWASPSTYLHDEISTDKRNPTVNAYGPVYGSTEYSTDVIQVLDPKTNTASSIDASYPQGMPEMLGPGNAAEAKPVMPSAYWGDEKIWSTHINNHNDMLDQDGRVWLTAAVRGVDDPAYCKPGSNLLSAQLFPLKESHREIAFYDPKTKEYKYVDTCFETHHLQFGFDADNTLWTSGGGPVLGWIDTKKFLETGDAAASQGWTLFVLDTAGTGKRTDYVEPNQPVQPGKDKRIGGGFYAVMPSPADGSVWGTVGVFGGPQGVVRVSLGDNPPATALSEFFHIPSPGFGPRGGDIDSHGVVWVSLGSGHLASFDRRKCKGPLNGPNATGDQCPEGWSFYQYPGPGFEGIGKNSAEASYYTWVDQHNTLGLGPDVPISTGNENDAFLALKDGKWVILRVPYPLSFYAKGLDGRIDDANAGWKGRGLWSTTGDRTPWLHEGGKGSRPMVVHIQLRPNPLAD